MKIIFIGTGKFGSIVLSKLLKSKYKPDIVVCAYDKPVGRSQELCACETKQVATENKIEVLELDTVKEEKNIKKIVSLKSDLIIVADTNFILPKEVLDLPKHGCLNIHPSLLPQYRGPSPIQSVIFWGKTETGVTIIKMDERIDHGPIVAKQKVSVIEGETFEGLRNKLAEAGADLLVKTLPDWVSGKINPLIQIDEDAIYTKKFEKEDGRIDWKNTADYIERLVRALNPWPGTYTFFNRKEEIKRLKILKAKATDLEAKSFEEGKLTETQEKKPAILCSQGILLLEEVQVEGKNKMTGEEFLNGYHGLIGIKFE
ncbi:MAG: methionyl-tRNA formyltransferase [Candidatus Paceibacterota bacterium]|jgi:methionyl-tRNA formyltransferase